MAVELGLGSSSIGMDAILPWFEATLVNIDYGKRSQVLSGVALGSHHFSRLFIDGSYRCVPLIKMIT